MLLIRKLQGFTKKSKGGRNNNGHITVHNRHGKKDNYYRPLLTDILPIFISVNLEIKSIFKDDFRSCFLMEVLIIDSELHTLKGTKGFVLAFDGAFKGQKVNYGVNVAPKLGNRTFLSQIPAGKNVFDIGESTLSKKTPLLRSAGNFGTVFSKESKNILIRLFKKRKMISLPKNFIATIGKASNSELKFFNEKFASYSRKIGFGSKTRGVAKNPIDHPHGGGEGKSSGGRKALTTPWGRLTKGKKTRKRQKCQRITTI